MRQPAKANPFGFLLTSGLLPFVSLLLALLLALQLLVAVHHQKLEVLLFAT